MTQNKLDWPSLQRHGVPDWLRDAKFGIYFHWGPYAVQATFGEWYTHCMYQPGTQHHAHHLATYGDLATFGYKDFIPMFTGEHFDADDWAELFARAGARFTGPVAEHADGFSIYGTRPWRVFGDGPTKVVGGVFLEAKTQPFTARDIRFTQSDDALFVIALGWPEDGKIVIAPLGMAVDATPVERVELLGHDGPLQCDRTAEALTVQLPDRKPCDHAVTLRIGRARKENPC